MPHAWPLTLIAASIAAAFGCFVAGVVMVAIAGLRLKRHADALRVDPLIARLRSGSQDVARLQRDRLAMAVLVQRAQQVFRVV